MNDPGTCVISLEADRGIISSNAGADNVAANGVDVVVNAAS